MRPSPLAFIAALAVAGVPAGALGQVPPPSWLGVTFETPVTQLRPVLGDPVRLTRLPDALAALGLPVAPGMQPERKARYVLSFAGPFFLIVSERHGAVVGIQAFSDQPLAADVTSVPPDPNGIALGATEEAVLKAYPDARRMGGLSGASLVVPIGSRYVAAYSLAAGRVRAIDWFARPSTDPPGDAPALAEPAGDSPATAILDLAKTETEGIRWERMWADSHPCDGTTRWVKGPVFTSTEGARTYDAIRYTCPSTGATRTVYFDITAFFGKL